MINDDSFLGASVCIYHTLKGHLVEYSGQVMTPKMIDKLSCQVTEGLINLLFQQKNFPITTDFIAFLSNGQFKSRSVD